MEYTIRVAREEDAQAVHDIYGAYVDGEHVTFTMQNPSVDEYREKIVKSLAHYPFYIAESFDGKVLGYVCGSQLRPHDAYQWNVESTIMIAPDAPKRCGIASALYKRFMETLKQQGYQYVYAVIVDSNEASLAFHKALGFTKVGHFERAGFKNGKWKGIVWMNIALSDAKSDPDDPSPFQKDGLRMELATDQDADEILTLYQSYLHGPADWTEEYPSKQTIAFDLSRDALFVMKNEQDEIVAAVSIDLDEEVEALPCWDKSLKPSGELSRMCVREDYQNRGIAKQMMKRAIQTLKASGYKSVHFLVKTGHTTAMKAYEPLGFTQVGSCQLFGKDFICFEKALDETTTKQGE